MKTALAFLILGCSGLQAFGQDLPALPARWDPEVQSGGPRLPEGGQTEWSLELFFRYSMLQGNDGSGGKWKDDFSDGLGTRLEGTFEYHLDQHWSFGAFLSAGFDVFRGKSSGGVSFDDWLIVPVTVGPKARLYFGPNVFAEAYGGAGFVSYDSVDAKALGMTVPVFKQSFEFAWEIGAHFVYKFNVDHGRAPSPQFGLLLGVGYESWGAPEIEQSSLPGASAKRMTNLTFDAGFWFGF